MFLCFEIKYNLSHNVGYSYSERDLDLLDIGTFISNWLVDNTKLYPSNKNAKYDFK